MKKKKKHRSSTEEGKAKFVKCVISIYETVIFYSNVISTSSYLSVLILRPTAVESHLVHIVW